MKKFWMKIHIIREEYMVAACDYELLGKEFKEGNLRLYVSPRFYGGKVVDEEKLIEELKKATIGNLVGENAVEAGRKAGVVGNVKKISGVPHAQFVCYFPFS